MTDEEKAEEYVVCNHCENYMLGKCHSKKCVKLYLDGLAEGRKEKWHDLRKNPNDLPKCPEDKQIIFFVKEYFIEKYINHYCLGFYKKSFMNDDVKLFVERSKGYECEHSLEEVIAWCELPEFENMKKRL